MIGLTLWPLVIIQAGNWKLIRKNVVLALPSLLQDYNLLSDFLLIWCRKWNIYKFFCFYSFIKLEILKSNNYNSDIWYDDSPAWVLLATIFTELGKWCWWWWWYCLVCLRISCSLSWIVDGCGLSGLSDHQTED